MVVNIAVALLAHHMEQFFYGLFYYDVIIDFFNQLPSVLAALYTWYSYFGTVLMLLFAAEAVNLFGRIVLVFSEIDHYATKATVIAWSKQHILLLVL